MSSCGTSSCADIGPNGAPPGGGGSGSVTALQAAIDAQGVVPTAQAFNTTIGLNTAASWFFTNHAGLAMVTVADQQATGIALTGRDTAAGGGQAIAITTGPSTAAGQTSGAFTLTTGASTDGDTGGVTITIANALGTSRAAGDINIVGGTSTGAIEGTDINMTCGAGGPTGGGGDFIGTGGAGGATSGAGGDYTIRGGAPVDGAGGSVIITGRDAATTTAANRAGGAVTIDAGDSTGTTAGASVAITAGNNTVNGQGGSLSFFAGDSGPSGTSSGGNADFGAGSSGTANGAGGDAHMRGGTGTGTARGGDVNKTPGLTGTGRPGMEVSLGAVAYAQVLSPSALAAGATQDYGPANFQRVNVVRITPNAAGSALGGLVFITGQGGREIRIFNIGTAAGQTLTLNHEDAGSVAANRFTLSGGINLVIPFGGACVVWYDVTSARFRVMSAQ